MNRRWGTQRFVDRCKMVRDRLDRPAITTDIIVGFPGETENEFAETCRTARSCGFSKIHVFPFSARRDTPAASMAQQIDKATKSRRGREMTAIEQELRSDYFRSLLGMPLRVLLESPDPEMPQENHVGTSCRYTPTVVPASKGTVGSFADVSASELTPRGLLVV